MIRDTLLLVNVAIPCMGGEISRTKRARCIGIEGLFGARNTDPNPKPTEVISGAILGNINDSGEAG